MAGKFKTTKICKTHIEMPELKASDRIYVKMHVTKMNRTYDVILAIDILTKLGIVLNFGQQIVTWGINMISRKPINCIQDTLYFINDAPDIAVEMDCMSRILDAKYQPEDLDKVAAKNKKTYGHTAQSIACIAKKHETLFDSSKGDCTNLK